MKGGTKIRKLWEILKTHEPPGLSVSFKGTAGDANGFSLDNSTFDSILGNIFIENNTFKEVYDYYLQFIKKDSKKYVLIAGDDLFCRFLNYSGINSKSVDEKCIKDTVTNSAELYSAIVLIDTKSYTKCNSIC